MRLHMEAQKKLRIRHRPNAALDVNHFSNLIKSNQKHVNYFNNNIGVQNITIYFLRIHHLSH